MAARPETPTPAGRYPRLRPGPGLSKEIVAAHQQARLQQAMIELVAAHGYEAVTVRGLAKRARISTGTFYKHYSSTDDCLLCTFDLICGRASRRVMEASESETEPRRRLARAVECLFQDMVAAPQATTFMLRAAPTVGPGFTDELRESAMQLAVALEPCLLTDSIPPLHPLLLEGVIAGLARIGSRLSPAAGKGELRRATAEAVEWTMGVCVPSDPDFALPVASVPGQPPNGEWEGVLGDERAMILAATFRIAKRGYHQLSVSRICREAGVSRRDFGRHFECLDDCFVAAVEERAAAAIGAWVQRGTNEALGALCDGIEGDRDWARVLFVEITAAGTRGIESRDRLISQVADALQTAAPEGDRSSAAAAEASAAAAWAILSRLAQDASLAATQALPALALLVPAQAKDRKHTAGNGKQIP